ncbi:MAG: hypothetical protein K940chlam7_00157 [Chlamydiae bacterium]|nr:hypothetical protein [Chlamydiota bacterium]
MDLAIISKYFLPVLGFVDRNFEGGVCLKSELLDPNERQNIRKTCSTERILAVAAAISIIAISLLLITTHSLLGIALGVTLAGLGLIVTHDFYRVADNTIKLIDRIAQGKISEDKLKNAKEKSISKYISQGTIFARSLVDFLIARKKAAKQT